MKKAARKPVKLIPVSDIKALCRKNGLTHVVVFGYADSDHRQYVASYGDSLVYGVQAANMANKFKAVLQWPEALQHMQSRGVLALKRANARLRKRVRELERAIFYGEAGES